LINFGITEQKKEELEQRMQKCGLLEKDLEEKFVRSGGVGGQKVNKTSTCVHLKHLPTGLAVKVQKSRTKDSIDFMHEGSYVNCLRMNCWAKIALKPNESKRSGNRRIEGKDDK